VVLISGEPGIGKSRLVDALRAEIGDKGYTRITIGCSPYHTNSALFPLIAHLERVLCWQREDGADVKLAKLEEALQDFSLPLDEAIPLFASLLSLPLPDDRYPPISVTPQQQKQQTLDATVAWLLEEAERQPVLQVWEDLHWADPSTLELLALEIEQAPTAPILNVLTFRPEFAPPWPQRSHMTPLTLNRLERPEVEALITLQAGGKALPGEVVEHIVGKTDGVPLYVEELTKVILEADFLREHKGSYRLTGPMSAITIPATLQDSLMARLDRLPNIREVAQLGAVLGREFAYEMVQAIASIEETTLQEGLAQLVDAELLYQRGRPPRAKYIFKHALVQDAAYQSLLKRTRLYYHRQVAELIEARFPEIVQTQPELVAHHYTEAGAHQPAARSWLTAGRLSIARAASREAIAHFNRGVEAVEAMDDGVQRNSLELDLQIAKASAYIAAEGYAADETERAYLRARALLPLVPTDSRHASILHGLYISNQNKGKVRQALAYAEELVEWATAYGDPETLCVGHRTVALTLIYMARFSEALEHSEKAVAYYDHEAHRDSALRYGHDPGVGAHWHHAFADYFLGYADRAQTSADQAMALSDEIGHPTTTCYAYFWLSWMHSLQRTIEGGRRAAKYLISYADERQIPYYSAMGRIQLGAILVQSGGEDDEALRFLDEGERGLEAKQSIFTRPYYFILRAQALLGLGRTTEALESLSEALHSSEAIGIKFYEPELYRVRALVRLSMAGEKANSDAQADFRQAMAVATQQASRQFELRAACDLARLWHNEDKLAEARELLIPIYDWFTEGFDTPDLKDAKALLDELS
jgi:predicted ATPase